MTMDNLTREEAAERARLITQLEYDVSLDLRDDTRTFGSRTTVRFGCNEPGASTFIDLDAADIAGVELNGRPIDEAHVDGTRIALTGLAERNELRVDAACRYQQTGTGMHRFEDPVDGAVYLYTQFEPFDAHRVYSCFDQPDLKGRFTFTVEAPAEWQVVSNMAADARSGGGWRFAPTPLMSTYITAICAGPFHVIRDRHGDIDLGLYCRESLAKHLDPPELFELTKQGLDFFEEHFAYPYPFGKYDQVFCPEYKFGAMENAGCVTFTERYIFRSRVTHHTRQRRAETLLHEMAHMWFGDLVTMRWWDDLWLNESFATYMAVLALVEATRFTDAWTAFASSEKAWAYREDQRPTTHPVVADIPDVLATHLNFDGITYAKGASVLKQLVAWVGPDAFRDGLRNYFRRYEYANATLADFLTALEEGSGRDLGAWSKEWLETSGVNTIRAAVDSDDGQIGSLEIVQSAPEDHPHLRSHRLAVGLFDLDDGKMALRRAVEIDASGERTAVEELAGEATAQLVLPNHADLAYAKIAFDAGSLESLKRHLHAIDDTLARSLCWNACWQMVRDAELPARDYLVLAMNNMPQEHDVGMVQTTLARANSGVMLYGDPGNRDRALAELADTARTQMRAAEAASDLQLAWAQGFIASARTPEQLQEIAGILSGSADVPGLAVDTDLRWAIVTALARAGTRDDNLIDAELDRDPTDLGRRRADQAHAARPTPEAKSRAWNRITGEDLPLATQRAVVAGFQQGDQSELLEPYVDRYFEAIPRVWKQRDIDIALEFVEGMYPLPAASERLVRLTDTYLAGTDVPQPVRRLLLEGKDDVERILRGRQVDAGAES